MKTVYSARPESLVQYFKNVWAYRSLVITLAKRDIKIKYAQSLLGLAWTAIQPLTGLAIFYFFFNKVVPLKGLPESGYAVFAFTGMTAWYFFSYIVYHSSASLLQGQELMKKVYFPKLILPLSKVLVGLVDMGVSLLLLIPLMVFKGIIPSPMVVFLPVFIVLCLLVGLSVSIWLSALTIKYRDLQHIVPYLINFGIWLTPVFFPFTMVPEEYRFLIYLNPMAGVIEGFRWSIWGYDQFSTNYFLGIGLALVLLVAGLIYFKKVEDKMVDIV